jgi:hypothetical protein
MQQNNRDQADLFSSQTALKGEGWLHSYSGKDMDMINKRHSAPALL